MRFNPRWKLGQPAVWCAVAGCLVVTNFGFYPHGMSIYAAPPPDSDGRFKDWFRSLRVPGSHDMMCCSAADCRMIEAMWNDQTQHFEAKVTRERFSPGLQKPILNPEGDEAFQKAKDAWIRRWIARFGDKPDVWIEIPDRKINAVQNPTGHAVLCWSLFNGESNGVYCFVPFTAT
jgi:hypothetical protein